MANQWDWVPRESLTQAQQTTLNQYCSGAYINAWQRPDDQKTRLMADLIYRDDSGTLYLQGGAELLQPEQSMSADQIQGQQDVYYQAQGQVVLRSDNQLIRSDSSYIAAPNNPQATEFNQATFLRHDTGLRGQAQSLRRDTNGVIFIEQGYYTTCEPGDGNWQLYGSRIKLDSESGFGTAQHVQIRIDGNPIFYFPWLRFPIDSRRQTGFLFPTFGYSDKVGARVSAPFYWNIAPNYDATFTPHFIEYDGEGMDIEFRHLNRFGTTVFEHATFMHERDGEQTLQKLQTTQKFNAYLSAGLLLERNLTPTDYPEETSISLEEKDNYERSGYLAFTAGNVTSKATIKRFQTARKPTPLDQPYEWLPRIDASYRYSNNYLDYQPVLQFTEFYDPDEKQMDGARRVANQTLTLTLENAWGLFEPGVLQQYRSYYLQDYKNQHYLQPEINHFTQFVNMGIVLERRFLQHDAVWRQTLEPKLNYVNAPFMEQDDLPNFDTSETTLTYAQAFDHKRFIGNDRIGDTEHVTLGLESRLMDSHNNERWLFTIGQQFYLKDRRIDINKAANVAIKDDVRSDILTSVTYREPQNIAITTNVNYDADQEAIRLGQWLLNYTPENGVRLKSSFLYTTDSNNTVDSKQSDMSAILPLSHNWHVLYQQTYDWLDRLETKKVTGFGFENCCLKASFNYQRWRNDDGNFDEGIFLQFILRSLSGVGRASSINSVATDYWNQGNSGY